MNKAIEDKLDRIIRLLESIKAHLPSMPPSPPHYPNIPMDYAGDPPGWWRNQPFSCNNKKYE